MDVGDLRHEHFADRIGDPFPTVAGVDEHGDEVMIELRLSAATLPPNDRPDRAHYAEWTGPREHFLEQGTYTMHHDELGELTLFIVPVNEVADGFVYEAVFTRVDD